MHSRSQQKKQAPKKAVKAQPKRTKTVKATKRVTKPISTASRSISTAQPTFKQITPAFTPITIPQRSFRSTQRLYSEPVPTGPAASEDISPEVQKIVQDILKLNIMQTLQLTKSLKKEFGYNDAAFAMAAPVAVAAAGAGAAAAPAEEEKPKAAAKTSFNVKLESYDAGSKVKIIKEVRTITGLGLKEAKELVDGAPQILKKEVKKEEAEAIVKLMKETGAVCILE